MKTGAVILAAGASTRLGQPKQILLYRGEALVKRSAAAALAAGCQPVIVVTGATAAEIASSLRGLQVELLANENWRRGLGTSIRVGLAQVADCDAVLLLVCDQPAVDADHLRRLIARQEETGQPMIASHYSGTAGVPALFTRACFSDLQSIADHAGAKTLLQQRPEAVATVDFPAGALDIDTPADLSSLEN